MKKIIILLAFIITTGFSCTFIPSEERQLLAPVTLSWWGVEENQKALQELISDYNALHPNIKVNYRQLRESEFERELINALAEDRGPDIFSIRNSSVDQYISKIAPLPKSTKMAFQKVQKSLGLKEETIVEIREMPTVTIGQVKNGFIDAVSEDVIRNDKIYGLPISVDNLVLFYNKDLLNNAGLPLPPVSWLQFQDYVKRLTFQNNQGKLIQSGAAIGRSDNVNYFFDIVSALMMQNGADMVIGNRALFPFVPSGGDPNYNPGPEAVRFYTDFANPSKEVYTWNKTFGNSLDEFAAGNVAMMFGYSKDIPELEAKRQGKLNYAITKIPQIEGRPEANIARYFVNTVSKKTKNINESWDFVQFIATRTEAKKYLDKVKQPTALRSLIEEQLADDDLNVFAEQILTSKSWYHGKDFTAANNAFSEMINSVLDRGFDPTDSAEIAAQKIEQTLK